MENLLDKSADVQLNMGNDFLSSRGAELFVKIAKVAKVFAIVNILATLMSLSYNAFNFDSQIRMDSEAIHYYALARAIMFILIDMLKFLPSAYILIFANKYTKAFKAQNSALMYQSFKALNTYFIMGIILFLGSQLLIYFSIFLYPYLGGGTF
jgi:hypothetical protein